MTNAEIFNAAYEDTLQHLFKVYFDARLIAKNDTERGVAEDRFRAGVHIAEQTRERAIALFP